MEYGITGFAFLRLERCRADARVDRAHPGQDRAEKESVMQAVARAVLVVHDDIRMREAVLNSLSQAGYPCMQANNAQEAVQLASEREFSLAVTGLRVPGGSSLGLLDELRGKNPGIAVIVLTPPEDAASAIDCLKKGADDYLLTPINQTELQVIASRALDRQNADILRRGRDGATALNASQQRKRLRRSFLQALESLAYCHEAKDPYSKGHSDRVARLSMSILRTMNVESPTQEQMHIAGQLHDIGKIGVKESVLHKPGPLSENELEHVKSHPIIAARILRPVIQDVAVADMILHHHERFDGRGYPHGLAGDSIPLGSRILAVADSVDAMTSPRPYRPPESVESALREVQDSVGTRYDPDVVKALSEVLSRDDWVMQLERDRTHVFLKSSTEEC